MEIKIINPLRVGFKITLKIEEKNCNRRLIQLSSQLLMWLSSVYGPHMPESSGQAPDEMEDGVLGDLFPDPDQGISELLDSLWHYLAEGGFITR